MAVEKKIFDLLSTSSAITVITSTRIFPVVIPQGVAAFPALVYSRFSGHREYSLEGYTGWENPGIRISCVSRTYTGAKELVAAVHAVMQTASDFHANLQSESDDFDWDSNLYQIMLDYSIWNQE
jgi:hypothetical protein